MDIQARIEELRYEIQLKTELPSINFEDFDANNAAAACLVVKNGDIFAISKWVSPKRTRSYPYERVYNTLPFGRKITIIPIIKDEGADGDRDFLQWDTVALMSLLNVYVIPAYYHKAQKHKRYANKITKQSFDNTYIKNKITEIEAYHSSALHWNTNQMKQHFANLVATAQTAYADIAQTLNVKMSDEKGIQNFQKTIEKGVDEFMKFSREKAQQAQSREMLTIQPKEQLASQTKAKITIQNYLGGQYFLTVDETEFSEDVLQLIEGKHTNSGTIPSIGDIKDGLIKMMLYTNLKDAMIGEKNFTLSPILSLTSNKLEGEICENNDAQERQNFYQKNGIKSKTIAVLEALFEEAKKNKFGVVLKNC